MKSVNEVYVFFLDGDSMIYMLGWSDISLKELKERIRNKHVILWNLLLRKSHQNTVCSLELEQNHHSRLPFRIISIQRQLEINSENNSLIMKICSAEYCIYDGAWGPHDCNYISWNIAVCNYPHFVSEDLQRLHISLGMQPFAHIPAKWALLLLLYHLT
jgi:hypothetical protein